MKRAFLGVADTTRGPEGAADAARESEGAVDTARESEGAADAVRESEGTVDVARESKGAGLDRYWASAGGKEGAEGEGGLQEGQGWGSAPVFHRGGGWGENCCWPSS